MNGKRFTVLLLCFLICMTAEAQSSAPHLSGTVTIDRTQGLIKCRFALSNLPKLGKQYRILLYRGFNIALLKNDTGTVLGYDGFYNSKLQGEAAAYVLEKGDDTLDLPERFSISYSGAFPVFGDTLNSFDFKGLIGFNEQALRATEQSKWYPVVYDMAQDKLLTDVSYDLAIDCADCKSLYVNGDQAKDGPHDSFHSAVPRPLVLFCGDYERQVFGQSTFLNASLTEGEAAAFNSEISGIADFLSDYLKRPYGEKLTFLRHKAFEPFGPYRSWGFVVFPTIAVSGQGFKTEISIKTGRFRDTSSYQFYAHEMAHYYFGQVLQSNATLHWFFLESMAEFLSLKAAETRYGKHVIERFVRRGTSGYRNVQLTPLSQVSDPEKMDNDYRYTYGPALMLAMEKYFGRETVKRFCQQALNQPVATDYPFLVQTAKAAGIDDKSWKDFEMQILNQKEANAVFSYLAR